MDLNKMVTAGPDDWMTADGKECPDLGEDVLITVEERQGELLRCIRAKNPNATPLWQHSDHPGDFVRWRYPTVEELAEFSERVTKMEAIRTHLDAQFETAFTAVQQMAEQNKQDGYLDACMFVAYYTAPAYRPEAELGLLCARGFDISHLRRALLQQIPPDMRGTDAAIHGSGLGALLRRLIEEEVDKNKDDKGEGDDG